ncbi:MAG: lysylphosphatidylglycerol synthase transmembrane domain-containing protein [bacterium]
MISLIMRVAVSAAIFIFVISKIGLCDKDLPFFERFWTNFSAIISNFRVFSAGKILVFLLIFFVMISIAVFRWKILLINRGFKISFARVFKYSIIGLLFNNVMPSTLGGDIIKGYYIHRDAGNMKKTAVFTIFADRAIGALATLIFIFFGALYLQKTVPQVRFLVWLLLAGFFFMVLFAVFLDEKFLLKTAFYKGLSDDHILRKIHSAVFFYKREGRSAFLTALFLSFFIQTAIISLNYFIMVSFLKRPLPFFSFLCVIPVINVIQGIPVSFAGWGIGEAAYSVLFNLLGISSEISVATSLVNKILILIISSLGLPVYIMYKPSKIKHLQTSAGKN